MALKGVVLDSGHGGNDQGSSGNGIIEKELTLKISQYMYDRFKALGVPVKMTRTSDVDLEPNDRPGVVLDKFGNGKDVVVISNHINAGGGEGAEVIYALRNSDKLASSILNELEKSGQVVRKYYQRRLPSDSSKDYYYIIRNTPNNETLISSNLDECTAKLRASPPARISSVPSKTSTQRHGSAIKLIIITHSPKTRKFEYCPILPHQNIYHFQLYIFLQNSIISFFMPSTASLNSIEQKPILSTLSISM